MKTLPTLPDIERRYTVGAVELRAAAESPDKRTVRGYAAMFGKRSANLGGQTYQFFEVIERGAFDDVLNDDVRALFNHDSNLILARSKAGKGTLRLGTDDTGLWYEFEPSEEQSYARDLLVSLKRGDVDQSSFAFSVTKEGQKWEETTEDGVTITLRTIKKVARLYDVSPVTYPAYPDATVALRSLEEHRAAQTPPVPTVSTFPMRSLWAARLGLR